MRRRRAEAWPPFCGGYEVPVVNRRGHRLGVIGATVSGGGWLSRVVDSKEHEANGFALPAMAPCKSSFIQWRQITSSAAEGLAANLVTRLLGLVAPRT